MRNIGVVGTLLLSLIVNSGTVWGQATAQISGTVRDQSGAVLPGVEVTATQTDTGVARTTVTNETGLYILPNLAIGPYRLEAALPGFRTFVQTGIVLQVNSNPVINPALQVGQVTEQIEVQANATQVETRTSGVGSVIENTRILELPLNGRQVTDLIPLAGAANPSVRFFATTGANPFNRVAFSIAGGLGQGISFALDGASFNNPANNLEMPMPFPNALQEFKVETSALGPQSGLHSAGGVNAVTKAGTNEFHGDLFEFVRNYKFNARNAFAATRDSLKRNQFGGTIGGPIKQNKLFFFAGYQGTYLRQDPAATIAFVPTPAMLAGDFRDVASPACNGGRQVALRGAFVDNRVPVSQLSAAASKFASYLPPAIDSCGKVIWGNRLSQDSHQLLGRLDYQLNANHSLFGRYMATTLDAPSPYTLSKNLLATTVPIDDALAQSLTFGDTYLFGANIVNSFRLTGNRNAASRSETEVFSLTDIGVNMFSGGQKSTVMAVTDAFSVGSVFASNGQTNVGVFAINDDVSLIRGKHQIALGFSGSYYAYNYFSNSFSRGNLTFSGQVTGLALADFLTGTMTTYTQSPRNSVPVHQRTVGLYASDTWKATPRLTLNGGLRWEPYISPTADLGSVASFDLAAFRSGKKTTQFRNAPPGLFYPGDPGFPGKKGMYNQWRNFSPRVGLAWDVNGDGRTSVRAAYGLFYDFEALQFYTGLFFAPPWEPRVTTINARFDDPWAGFPGGNPFPYRFGPDAIYPAYSLISAMKYDTKNPQISQWNLSIQRQVSDWLVSVSYLGSQSSHLWTQKNLNPAVNLGTAPCTLNGVSYPVCSTTMTTNQRRRLSLENPAASLPIGNMNEVDDGGTASYHGLLASVKRQALRGLTIDANYTWSHCISDPFVTFFSSGTGNAGYINPENRRFDRGNCTTSATDRRHLFNLTAVAETPRFSNANLRAIATGWRFSPILRLQSGGYLTVTTVVDAALNGQATQRVNQVLPDVYGDKTVNRYLNPAAFSVPATGTFGTSGAAAVLGPGYWQFDAALSRVFQIREGQRLEVRAEAFNLTNSLRMNDPVTNLNAGNFGKVISARDPRIMQFALKYVF